MSGRREYKSGAVYQRASDQRWIGTIEAGWTANGKRRRITVSAKTERACKAKLIARQKELGRTKRSSTQSDRQTVKGWAQEWLTIKRHKLRPKAYNAAASAVNKWIVPTIGHHRLNMLTPADARKVERAQRDAGLKGSTAAATHRTLLNMLRAAKVEGYDVPDGIFLADGPTTSKSDRMDVPLMEALAILAVASQLDHGTRWATALLFGLRQGECLGLTWDAIDFDRDELAVEWQLQSLPYVDRKNKALGFRVPEEFEARHLVDAWHLTRPKSKQGVRLFPLIPALRDALLTWREVAPENPWRLVWPTTTGRPANNKHDLEEWHALQCTAGVGHPGGRYYHVHETRNAAASRLREVGADESVITSLLGHASIQTSRGYMRVNLDAKRTVLEALGEQLLLPPATS